MNNCVCHYSPLESESNVVELVDGDVVKMYVEIYIVFSLQQFMYFKIINKNNNKYSKIFDHFKGYHLKVLRKSEQLKFLEPLII